MNTNRHKLVPACYLFLTKDNEVLLQKRCNTGYKDGEYGLVAGHVEQGESFKQALVREAKEEIGIDLCVDDFEVVHVMHRMEQSDPPEIGERIDVFLKTKKYKGAIKNMEPHKCDDLSWFPINELPENTIIYIKFAIEKIKSKIFYSQFGW